MSNTPISIRSDVEFVRRVRRQAHVKKWTWENFSRINAKNTLSVLFAELKQEFVKGFFHKK